MKPLVRAYVIINCARYAVVALTMFAAWQLDSGGFLFAAVAIALFGGSSYSSRPDACPKCGHIIKEEGEGE